MCLNLHMKSQCGTQVWWVSTQHSHKPPGYLVSAWILAKRNETERTILGLIFVTAQNPVYSTSPSDVFDFIIHMKVVKVAADTVGKLFVSSVCVILTLLHLSDNALLLVSAHCNKSSNIFLRVFVKLQLDTKIPAAHISWCCYSYVSNFSNIFTGH
jgi:hypothetical protein